MVLWFIWRGFFTPSPTSASWLVPHEKGGTFDATCQNVVYTHSMSFEILGLRIRIFCALLVGLATGTAHAITLYVDRSAVGANNGLSWNEAFVDLQDALLIAQQGDQIWIANGEYHPAPPGNEYVSFVVPTGVALYGGFAGGESLISERNISANPTILSGDLGDDDVYGSIQWSSGWNITTPNSDCIVNIPVADADTVLDGLTIQQAHSAYGSGAGARIVGGSPRIANCTFWRNLAGFAWGGGLMLQDSQATITNTRFIQNWCHLGNGGGIYIDGASQVTVIGCEFTENTCTGNASSGSGAGIETRSSLPLTVTRSRFRYNNARPFGGGSYATYGGGIHSMFSQLTVDRCTFVENSSMLGGGIHSWRSATITNSVFLRNHADPGFGGGISVFTYAPSNITIVGCTLVGNSAHDTGGIWMEETSPITARVSSCILWKNRDIEGMVSQSQIRGTGAKDSCIYNLWVSIPGEDPIDPEKFPRCFDYNPQFVSETADFHLRATSPCLDRADRAAFPVGTGQDLEGYNRFVDSVIGRPGQLFRGIPDMGCYERDPRRKNIGGL